VGLQSVDEKTNTHFEEEHTRNQRLAIGQHYNLEYNTPNELSPCDRSPRRVPQLSPFGSWVLGCSDPSLNFCPKTKRAGILGSGPKLLQLVAGARNAP
jgi:hypothetical protein